MPNATFYDKRLFCHIDVTDFTDYQGINGDLLYKRYDSVNNVVKNNIDEKYQELLSAPFYEDDYIYWYVPRWKETPICITELEGSLKDEYERIKKETLEHYKQSLVKMTTDDAEILRSALKHVSDEFIYCYDGKIVLVVWGMRPDTEKHQVVGSWLRGLNIETTYKVTFDCGLDGVLIDSLSKVKNRKEGYVIANTDIPEVKAKEGYEFVSWEPNPIGHVVKGNVTFVAKYNKVAPTPMAKVSFSAGSHGDLEGEVNLECPIGEVIPVTDIPMVSAHEGYKFSKWTPMISSPITGDTTFTAEYEKPFCTCVFDAGENGKIEGRNFVKKPYGSSILATEIPKVKPKRGYKFTGWDIPLSSLLLNGDIRVRAQYEKKLPWYKRLWLWLTGKGCLKRLLWLLLIILLILLFIWLLRGCVACGGHKRDTAIIQNKDSISKIPIKDITDKNGDLPKHTVIAPVIGDDGEEPPIIHNDGAPDIVGNRLNIYFDDDNADLNKWAKDFKEAYPSDDYIIVGYDPNVPMIQIQIPESQRNRVREEINQKIPDQDFFVVDESIIDIRGKVGSTPNEANKGWHIKATNLRKAWDKTKGSEDVVVAIVDDGIDVGHPMLKGRYYKAYNVFTQDNKLNYGIGHGTHVAGLAVGSDENVDKGATGVAPKCKIMPVQVFNNQICTFSSIASGIMYAIHNGADVVNVSIGPTFVGLDQLPIEAQKEVAENFFKNEERVFRHMFKVAKEKNIIIVFAAGNDNILAAIPPECRSTSTINVAAITPDFKRANFSNYSIGANASAPGVDIYSSFPVNSFKMMEGTSMAAPIVTGAIALMRSIKKDITAEQVLAVLAKSGKPISNDVPNMILIDEALELVEKGDFSMPKGTINPPSDTPLPSPSIGDDDNNMGKGGDSNIDKGGDSNIGNGNEDDYNRLKNMLEKLKSQRNEIDEKIKDIEEKLKKG